MIGICKWRNKDVQIRNNQFPTIPETTFGSRLIISRGVQRDILNKYNMNYSVIKELEKRAAKFKSNLTITIHKSKSFPGLYTAEYEMKGWEPTYMRESSNPFKRLKYFLLMYNDKERSAKDLINFIKWAIFRGRFKL